MPRKESAVDRLEAVLQEDSDGIDMERQPHITSRVAQYSGAIFDVDELTVALPKTDGGEESITRQLVKHAPSVVMIVHDSKHDKYLVEREYRVGCNGFVFGLPAGLMDGAESVDAAALRELREETGIVPTQHACTITRISDSYSSMGMSDEISHVISVELHDWNIHETHCDSDEHVQSAWITWDTLKALKIQSATCVIALQSEALKRAGIPEEMNIRENC
ncbi:NUDIX hydrolase [Bifidobacterium aquikefiri]|uniref:NUDIX hydrolase n=1 Tax=Bifidobacterium aquikefiri TaxID=1653207 RepID=UPI0023F04578|nr:NUDIX hydrolase [Bifidobacterium aquikefiri]